MMSSEMEFSPFMIVILGLCFLGISYFMGMLIHSAWMYEDKNNMRRDTRKAWTLCMVAGTGITGWMFFYGYYVNFIR